MGSQADSLLRLAERVGLAMAARGSNFIFSPLSIRLGLSIIAVGSAGQTLEQMLSFLGSPTLTDLSSAFGRILDFGSSDSDEDGATNRWERPRVSYDGFDDGPIDRPRLSFVGGTWVNQTLELKPAFQEEAASIYGAVTKSVDFEKRADEVRIEVNDWVKEKTDGLIENLIPEGAVDNTTRLLIANALRFKGSWDTPFESSQTINEEFHLLDGSTIQVPFMTSREYQRIASYDGFKVLQLNYNQGRFVRYKDWGWFSMLIFLPHKKDGLDELINNFVSDPDFVKRHMPQEFVQVEKFRIPKFKISFGFEVSGILKDLGLESPFSPQADFHEMCDQQLSVSRMLHKASIEVDEEGTLVDDANAILDFGAVSPLSGESADLEDFEADHPFVFVIREAYETGSLLFFGHVVNPLLVDQA